MASQVELASRLRRKLDTWSDDDEDVLPKRVERESSPSPPDAEEELDLGTREHTPAEPSPSPIIPARKRIPRATCLDSDDEDEPLPAANANAWPRKVDPPPRSPKARTSSRGAGSGSGSVDVVSPPRHRSFSPAPRPPAFPALPAAGPAMQAPIQPGCTKFSSGNRRFLAYNMLGCISSVENDGFTHIEVDFHDTGRGLRVPSMTDYFGFTLAAMNEKGSVFANPKKGEKIPSTIMYRPFNSWTNNSEWSMRFPVEEEVKGLGIGNGWAAAATSQHLLRVYSEAGLQKFVLSLAGPVVALAGNEDLLAVVTHASTPLPSGDQVLEILLFNVREQRRLMAGRLPLSPASTLTWLGFTEAGCLSVYDSQGVLRVYSSEYSGCWIPVFSAAAERKEGKDSYWMVGLNSTQVYCVICKSPDTEPQVVPKPVLSVINTAVPVVHSDLGADDLENDFLRGTLILTDTRLKADEAAATGRDDNDADESVLKMEGELDRCLLRLIAAACKGDKLARALELCNQLSLHKSMEGALKLVNAMRLPSLAERINLLLEERIARERMEDERMEDGGMSTFQHEEQGAYTAPVSTFRHQTAFAPSQGLPKAQPYALAAETTGMRGSDSATVMIASTSNASADATPKQQPTVRPLQSMLKVSHKKPSDAEPKTPEGANSAEDSQAASVKASTVPQGSFVSLSSFKPSNPFAKKPKPDENKPESMLESIKKMQKVSEPEGKRKADAASLTSQQRPAKVGKAGR